MLNPSKRNASDAALWVGEEQRGSLQSGPLRRDEEIDGDSAAEQIDGEQGDDSIEAGAGADTLEGGKGDDTLDGGKGDDLLIGGSGGDTYALSRGDDTIQGYKAGDQIVLSDDLIGAGLQRKDVSIENTIINGKEAAYLRFEVDGKTYTTTVIGIKDGAEEIKIKNDNLAGDNIIESDEKNDNLEAGKGDDQIDSGAGNDTVDGGRGDDQINGEKGNDSIEAGAGADTLDGGKGTDSIDGGLGNDVLDGGKGDDVLNGGDGDDLLIGGSGADTYQLSRGDDTIRGYKGGDAIELSQELIDAGLSRSDITIEPTRIDGKEAALLSYTLDGRRYTTTVIGIKDAEDIEIGAAKAENSNVYIGDKKEDNRTKGENNLTNTEDKGTETWTKDGTGEAGFAEPGSSAESIVGGMGDDYIFGNHGEDTIRGEQGKDTLYGNQGNDEIYGNGGNDFIHGGDENDTLVGSGGKDEIYGWKDDDLLQGGADNDILNGGDGNDLLQGGADNDTLNGGDGNDTLDGGSEDDAFVASKGNDVIKNFKYGEDKLIDDTENGYTWDKENIDLIDKDSVKINVLENGGGDPVGSTTIKISNYKDFKDALDGTATTPSFPEDEEINGGEGNDVTDGENWANGEIIEGTKSWSEGNSDQLQFFEPTGDKVDVVNGKGGDDYIFTLGQNDTIDGGSGNDTLFGNSGNDEVNGGAGNDLVYGNNDDDTVRGDVGDDTLNGGAGNDRLVGNQHNDQLYGNDGDDKLFGSDGNDILNGGDGNDEMSGEAGHDRFKASLGDDTIKDFVFGIDELIASNNYEWDGGSIVLDSSQNSASINVLDKTAGETVGTTVVTIENFDEFEKIFNDPNKNPDFGFPPAAASDPDTKLIYKSDNKDFEVIGGTKANIITVDQINEFANYYYEDENRYLSNIRSNKPNGATREDSYSIDGKQGDDTITGGIKDDSLHGGAGDDKLDGGLGNDRLLGGSDNDTIEGEDGDDKLFGWDGNDSLDGGTGNDYLKAENGDDTLDGGKGDDTLDGGEGNDILWGRDDDDSLIGGEGSDRLHGHGGDDTLNGGAGKDLFFANKGNDVIEDFTFGEDSLQDANNFIWDRDNARFDDDKQEVTIDVLEKVGSQKEKVGTTTIKVENYGDLIAAINKTNEEIGFPPIGASDPKTELIFIGKEQSQSSNKFQIIGGNDNNPIDVNSIDEFAQYYYSNDARYKNGSGTRTEKPETVQQEDQFTIDGGAGNDTINGGYGDDLVEGGEGNDWIREDNADGNDTLLGGKGNDKIGGGHGDDSIEGGDGNDILSGQNGDDTLTGGNGADKFKASIGNDTIKDFSLDEDELVSYYDKYFYDTSCITLDPNENSVSVKVVDTENKKVGTTTIFFEDYKIAEEAQTLNELCSTFPPAGASDPDSYIIFEKAKSDRNIFTVNGGNQGNMISVEGINEFATFYVGNDSKYMVRKDGTTKPTEATKYDNYSINGFDGNDTITSGNAKDTIDGGEGNDIINGQGQKDTLRGDHGDDTINGGEGNDALFGHNGEDSLEGGNGNDRLHGGYNNDTLVGGKGDDELDGRKGDDELEGGEGIDTFVASEGSDIIKDFVFGEDQLKDSDDYSWDKSDFTLNQDNNTLIIGTIGNKEDQEGKTTIFVQNFEELTDAINKANEEIGFPPIGASDPKTKLIYKGEEKGIKSFKALGGNENNFITPESTNEFADFYYEDNSRYNTKSRDESKKPKAVTTNDQFDLDGGEGNDTLLGGTKNDILDGGSGNDEIYGSGGRDRLDGGEDDDLLDGGDQHDTMDGGAGNDIIKGGYGDDFLEGGDDNDKLFGNAYQDTLNGGEGDDTLDGGKGKDTFILSPGDDYLIVDIKDDAISVRGQYTASVLERPSQPDSDGNSFFKIGLFQNSKDIGTTTIQYKPADLGVSNELPIPPMPGLPDPISEDLPQNEGNNKPNGSGQGETGDNSGGNGGNSGGSSGGSGEKPGNGLEDAPGADNNGDNSTEDKPGSEGSIDGEPITPPVDPDPGQPEPEATALRVIDVDPRPKNNAFESIESGSQKTDTVIGSKGIDKLRGKKKSDLIKGKKGADYLYGDNGADSLMGGNGADVLQGGNGKDALKGGAGRDILYGGKEADVLTGNTGKDTFILSKGKDVITDFKVKKDAIGLVYALDLNFKQKGDDLLIKGNDGVKTLLLDTDKDKFLSNFPGNLEIVPAVEINLI
ncbi:hypothetical protein [Synechococcus sp. PROS-U-1]|uniref:calcium-binding protein n=1 Tax=Synechococcus sp. PROS-U-1 TaxID=1400866 RepID=UPI0018607C16|nr:hypothetical protein [Synechococcus sp. PROS-U-1]QNJ03578.1 hemolysin-type calcium-binding repeat family protein [Synechococcus sp. PROS-U-1]